MKIMKVSILIVVSKIFKFSIEDAKKYSEKLI